MTHRRSPSAHHLYTQWNALSNYIFYLISLVFLNTLNMVLKGLSVL